MRRHATRGTHESFLIIPPNQDTSTPDERGSPAVHSDAKPSRRDRIAEKLLARNSFVCRGATAGYGSRSYTKYKTDQTLPFTPPRVGTRHAKVKLFVMSYGRIGSYFSAVVSTNSF
jgi:hypothetical protein